MSQSRLIVLSLAVFTMGAPLGRAQDAPAPPKDKKEKALDATASEALRFSEEVDVAVEIPGTATDSTVLKLPMPLQTTPASVSVVPAALLTEQDAFVLGDALKNAPGVNVAPGFGTFDFFTIRGFDSLSSGLVLTDGASEPESTFYPTYNLKRVEVVRGAAAFLYGTNPLAGAVNLVRKQPTSGRYADVTLGYGSYNNLEGALDGNYMSRDGHLAVRLNGLYQQTDGYRDGREGGFRGCNPALTWKPNDATRLTLNVEYVRAEFAPDSGIPVLGDTLADVPRTQSYQSPLDESRQDLYRYRLDFERKANDRLTIRDKVYYTDLKWDSNGSLINGAFPSPVGMLVARSLVMLNDRQHFFGNQAEAAVTFSTGHVAHTLLGGFEVSRQTDEFTQDVAFLPLITLENPVDTTTAPVFTIPQLGQKGDGRSLIFAPYVADRIVFSPKFQATVGGRLDVLNYDDPKNSTSRDATKLSPLGGIVYSPVPSVSVYASAGSAFGAPSTAGLRPPRARDQPPVRARDQGFLPARQGARRDRGLRLEAGEHGHPRHLRPPASERRSELPRNRDGLLGRAAEGFLGHLRLRLERLRADALRRERPDRPRPAGLRGRRPLRQHARLRPASPPERVGQQAHRPWVESGPRRPLRQRSVHCREQRVQDPWLFPARRHGVLHQGPDHRDLEPQEPHRPRVRDPGLLGLLGRPRQPVHGLRSHRSGARRAELSASSWRA